MKYFIGWLVYFDFVEPILFIIWHDNTRFLEPDARLSVFFWLRKCLIWISGVVNARRYGLVEKNTRFRCIGTCTESASGEIDDSTYIKLMLMDSPMIFMVYFDWFGFLLQNPKSCLYPCRAIRKLKHSKYCGFALKFSSSFWIHFPV